MKISNIETLKPTLLILSQKELSFRLSYKVSKFLDKVEKDSQFYAEKLRNIVQKYALRDENGEIVFEGDNVKIAPSSLAAAEKELADLNDIDIEDPNIFFTLDEFEGLEIKPSELTGLLPFIKEE